MGRTAQTASQTAKKSKKEKRAKEGNDDRSKKRAKVSSNDKEDKKRKRLIKWMLDWEPDYTPEQLEKMTISDMEKIQNEPFSDDEAEEIDPDNEKVRHEYKGETYTSRELNNLFHREAYESNKRYCDYMKQKNKKGDKKPRGAPPKSNAWDRFLATNRTSLSAKNYKGYMEAEGELEDVAMPVLFTKYSGEKVLKVLEISMNDNNVRWAETGMEFDEDMEEGEDYL